MTKFSKTCGTLTIRLVFSCLRRDRAYASAARAVELQATPFLITLPIADKILAWDLRWFHGFRRSSISIPDRILSRLRSGQLRDI